MTLFRSDVMRVTYTTYQSEYGLPVRAEPILEFVDTLPKLALTLLVYFVEAQLGRNLQRDSRFDGYSKREISHMLTGIATPPGRLAARYLSGSPATALDEAAAARLGQA